MSNNKTEINKVLKQVRYQVFNLAGDRNKNIRQQFMQLITGEKLPKSKCGVTALEVALLDKAGIDKSSVCKFEIPDELEKHFGQ